MEEITQKAKEFAYLMHAGQKRKEGVPYITHPAGVVRIIQEMWPHAKPNPKNPKCEDIALSVGWLHDTLEDTNVTYEELKTLFGYDIASRVYLLSRNVSREEYKTRIQNSDYIVKFVKIADVIHNIQDPHSFSYVSQTGIRRKLEDCISFYIPLATQVCPILSYKLTESVNNCLKTFGGMR